MSDKISLTAELRSDVGKGASRRLRRDGDKVPAIIYGADKDPQNLTLAVNELTKAMEQEAFYSQILDVVVDGAGQDAVVRDLQRNPATGRVMHVDFQRISADQAIHVNVPLHFINEDTAPAVKLQGGIVSHTMTEVEVICLPQNLPEFIEVDMAKVELGTVLHLSDLVLPKGVELVELNKGADHDAPVVSVVKPAGIVDDEDDAEEDAAEE